MSDSYSIKVAFFRVSILLIAILCFALHQYNYTDYVILISLIAFFIGIFSMSAITLTNREIKIRKNYFWGLVGIKKVLIYDQILSIKAKEYEIEMHEHNGIFDDLILIFYNPKVRWLTSKLHYVEKGIEKKIELTISKDDFRTIERRKRSQYTDI